jgi:beta-glucosidase
LAVPSDEEKVVSFADVVATAEGAERERVIDGLIKRMSVPEKVRQMAGSTSLLGLAYMMVAYGKVTYDSGRNRRLGIPALRFTDGPRGICLDHSTCFPVPMARGATWDTDLAERTGEAMGIEARAQGADFYGGVCVNVPRHPGWGRAQETFGEDPLLLGRVGAATVRGAQRHVMACVKHFACNSMEEARFFVDVRIDERTLREVYLPHFKACVDEGVASVMSAYNKVNGEYCGNNRHLLREILKDEWGFDGLVMSDFLFGVRDADGSATAGLDIEMPSRIHYGVTRRVKAGRVPMDAVDDAVRRVIRQKARFSGIDGASTYDKAVVGGPEHAGLALEAARKGIVLLKNEQGALPLDKDGMDLLGVVGPLCDRANIGDRGSSRVHPRYVVTALAGLRKMTAGSMEIMHETGMRGRKLDAVGQIAREADATVVVVGLDHGDEGEFMPVIHTGGDRDDLRLPDRQEALIKAVAAASDRCIVVMEGGSAIVTEAWADDVEAILMAWYPGMEGGTALAEVLFGEVNPSGRLPVTFPATNEQNPHFDRKAKSEEYGYYHGYRLFDRQDMKPAFAFGHGLSYTSFEYCNLDLSGSVDAAGSLLIRFDLKNTGTVSGAEVPQLYIGCHGSTIDRPVKELRGFERVDLEPGHTQTVTFEVPAGDLAYYDTGSSRWVLEDVEYTAFVGSSSADLRLNATFRITGI